MYSVDTFFRSETRETIREGREDGTDIYIIILNNGGGDFHFLDNLIGVVVGHPHIQLGNVYAYNMNKCSTGTYTVRTWKFGFSFSGAG